MPPITFIFIFKGTILIGSSAIFFRILRMPPIEALLWTPVVKKWKKECTLRFHLFSLCTGKLNFGQTIWDKTQVLLGTSWELHLGTHWEQRNKTQNPWPCPLKKKKNWIIHEWCILSPPLVCMKFFSFQNCWSPFFWPKLMAGTEFWGHSSMLLCNWLGVWWPRV